MGGASSETVSNVSQSPKRPRRADRHDQALLTAEVRQLAAQLHTSGPLQRDVLAKRCHTNWWHGTIEAAIAEGVRQHKLRRLPFGFVAAERPESTPARTRPKNRRGYPRDRRQRGTHPRHSAERDAPSATPVPDGEHPRPPRFPEGTAEAMPVALTLIAISIPVTLVALAATGGGVPLLMAAIVSMILVCVVIAIVLGRKLRDEAPHMPASAERSPQPHQP
jgi:hypothetical protein